MPWITRPKASTTTPGASFRPPTPTPPTGLNQRTEYAYAARGLPLTVIEAAGTPLALTTVHTYDTLGRVTQSTVDPTGLARSATYEYDLNNRLIRETGPPAPPADQPLLTPTQQQALRNLHTSTSVYDRDGRLTRSIDALGRSVEYQYDDANRLIATIDPLGIGLTESNSADY